MRCQGQWALARCMNAIHTGVQAEQGDQLAGSTGLNRTSQSHHPGCPLTAEAVFGLQTKAYCFSAFSCWQSVAL